MRQDGPTPEDFAAASRGGAQHGSWCSAGCAFLVVGVALAAAGALRPVGEISAVFGGVVIVVVVGLVLRSAVRIARKISELLPMPGLALPALFRATPEALGWLVLRVHSQPGGEIRWLALTFDADEGCVADARWLPGGRADQPVVGGRRVWAVTPERARPLASRLRMTLGPPAAVSAPVDVRDGAPFEIAGCWSGLPPQRVKGNLSSTRPPEGDLWAELVEAGLPLVDEGRATT